MKVSIIGAGAVGASCAEELAKRNIVTDVVLVDVKPGIAEGKASDIYQACVAGGLGVRVRGACNDYAATKDSRVIVVTSGIPRKPNMTREELIGTNANIIKEVVNESLLHSPNAIFVIVSNPVDTLTYLTRAVTNLPATRVVGLGGVLDSSRFKANLSLALQCSPTDIEAMVIGGHGDTTMIPLIRHARLQGKKVTELLSKDQCDAIVHDTMNGGAILTKLLGTSAWYAPGAAAATMVKSIVRDEKRVLPCCTFLNGEYGQKDIFIGTPVVLGRQGVEKVFEIALDDEEAKLFAQSAEAVRKTNAIVKG